MFAKLSTPSLRNHIDDVKHMTARTPGFLNDSPGASQLTPSQQSNRLITMLRHPSGRVRERVSHAWRNPEVPPTTNENKNKQREARARAGSFKPFA